MKAYCQEMEASQNADNTMNTKLRHIKFYIKMVFKKTLYSDGLTHKAANQTRPHKAYSRHELSELFRLL